VAAPSAKQVLTADSSATSPRGQQPVGLASLRVLTCSCRNSRGISGGDLVLVRESAEDLFPADRVPGEVDLRWPAAGLSGCELAEGAVRPACCGARGRIVIISTIGARFNPPFAGALDAAKAALTALADALRQELTTWDVQVVLIEPASINSGAADKVARDAAAAMAAAPAQGRTLYEDTFAKMIAVMQRREGGGSRPDVVAATIIRALASSRPRSVYLTGGLTAAGYSQLPALVLDRARRRVFRLPPPGSLAS